MSELRQTLIITNSSVLSIPFHPFALSFYSGTVEAKGPAEGRGGEWEKVRLVFAFGAEEVCED